MSENGPSDRLTRRTLLRFTAAGTGGSLAITARGARAASGEDYSGVQANGNDPGDFERARTAYEALETYFYRDDHGLFLEEYPREGGNPYSYAWPFSQAMAATVDLYGARGRTSEFEDDVEDRLEALELYWHGEREPPGYDSYVRPPLGGGGDKFYDDNLWLGLEFVRLYRLFGDEALLSRARQIFELTVYGWADDPSLPCPGGVYWTEADWNDDRNTVSTAPGAKLGLHLYELSDDPDRREYYLEWATRMYEWVEECLRAPNGLYWDNIDLDGNIWEAQFSYNQGTMIGASALLYRNTGDERYLERANEIAETALEHYGSGGRFHDQDIDFNAIFFSNLLLLSDLDNDPRYVRAMREYADESWERYVDPDTGLIEFDRDEPTTLLEQSAIVRIYASLAWARTDYEHRA